jgi:hypothetical protein
MDDLVTWLRAQLDAREQQLTYLSDQGIDALIAPDGTHVVTEVKFGLAQVDATRRILDDCRDLGGGRVLKLLALPHAGRDGWREEWRA